MSGEQEKDTISLKRNRGGDGGLDGLGGPGGPGTLLGSPDKKKRKSNTQASSFAPLSEYAPPPNPSAEHLVAANPFDDNYNTPSYKPLPSGNPYFGHPHYPGFGGYGPHRMPPHMSPRMPSAYGGPYPMRNQLHPFAQNQMGMGFNRPPGFNYGHHESPGYGNHPVFNNNMPLPPNQPFRPGPGDHFSQMPPHSMNQNSDMGPNFGQEGNSNINPPMAPNMDASPGFMQPQNNFNQTSAPMPKQDFSEATSKSVSQNPAPCKQSQNPEDNVCQDNSADLKTISRSAPANQDGSHSNTLDKLNGMHPNNDAQKNPTQPCGAVEQAPPKRSSSGSSSNKAAVLLNRPGHSSTDPVYPCGICMNEVNDDQEAILCEASCQKWFHRVCTGMTETAYNLLTAEVSAVWGCDTCMEGKGVPLMRTRELVGQQSVNAEG
ncbi:pygopus homolog 1 [Lepisosteus oculatus]|uniref:Pygopus family PHD finger 1 n=1 Tax=Lepisosteus oculatus TaxID=7918 RepID=W5N7K6_LEPOC|nr:PREDICTED: pygopus homolog 1 [Lepisosteus oculatus]